MPTQRQLRGAATGTQSGRTLASREPDVDTTTGNLHIHDGSTPGGLKHALVSDIQDNVYNYAAASGTNALTATLAQPPDSIGAGFGCLIKIANTNTDVATLNINSLGAENIKKFSGGSKVSIGAGDLPAGAIMRFDFDGTDFVITPIEQNAGLVSVSQGDLNTSQGTFSRTPDQVISTDSGKYLQAVDNGGGHITLPGGEYGFGILSRQGVGESNISGWWLANDSTSYIAGAVPWVMRDAASLVSVLGSQRYVSSSPPFDLGDGEAAGFIFLEVNKAGEVLGHYAADVPPWGYNGPTRIRADKIDRRGRKYRTVRKFKSLEAVISGEEAPREVYEEITDKIKNADMNLIPTPFTGVKKGNSVVLLDVMDPRVRRIIDEQNAGGDLFDLIARIKPDNERLSKRAGPKSVMQCSFKI